MSNKVYDVLKWITLVGLYALNYLWTELAEVWSFPYAVEISKTITIIGGTLGIILGVSSVKYNLKMKAQNQNIGEENSEIVIENDENSEL